MSDRFHYTMCGLPDVYLMGGFHFEDTPRGRRMIIQDQDALHQAIGEYLIGLHRGLTGPELRFLREELTLSQVNLARILGESDQSVARREKKSTAETTPGSQDRLLRALYRDVRLTTKAGLSDFLKQLADADNQPREKAGTQKITCKHAAQNWHAMAA